MPIRYRIDVEAGLVFVRGEGEIVLPDLEAYSAGVVRDPLYRAGMHELVDFRGVSPRGLTTQDLEKFRDVNRSLADRLAPARLALLVDTEVGYGLGRMFAALSEDSKIETRVFRDEDDALAWVRTGAPAGGYR